MIRRVNAGNITIYGNGKLIHADGNTAGSLSHENGRNDMGIVIFDGNYWMFNYWVR